MAVVEVSITPLGTKDAGVSHYVAGCLKVVKDSGMTHMLTPMGTILEGDLDQILTLIRKMQESVFKAGAVRVSTLIKIDDRRDKEHTMKGKLASVESKLSKPTR